MKEEGEEGENKDKRKQNERQEMKSEWEGLQSGGRDSVPSY